ncbi:MAG: cell division protein ZapA [Flavobacteriaceae bacterium]|nr:cell division protein ZapA [Flavobacteriaceae bacterium]MCY4254157.1 cell division protein ZapA [Flavobacteriaceae bacterium]
MNHQEIKLVIGGRIYPVNASSDREPFLKETADQINKRLLTIEAKYAIKNKQDSLAMLALQLMVTKNRSVIEKDLKTVDKKQKENQEVNTFVDALISKIDFHMKVD